MLKMKIGLTFILITLIIGNASAVGCGSMGDETARNSSANNNPATVMESAPVASPTQTRGGEGNLSNGLQVLAEGSHSRVSDAFIAVVRDVETYRALRALTNQGPEMFSGQFFRENAVVAAFLGTRRTGGYGVRITRGADGVVSVSEVRPPPDAITTQAITSPFRVVVVPVGMDSPVAVNAGGAWQQMSRPYRISQGEFSMSGGIDGRLERFQIEGEIRIMRQSQLATFAFALRSRGGARERTLTGFVTGRVEPNGRVLFPSLNPGTFVDQPTPLLSMVGQFESEESSFRTLEFMSHHRTYRGGRSQETADGFTGQGSLNAVATAPAPPRRNPSAMEDNPV